MAQALLTAVVIGLGHLDGRGNPLPQEIGATFQQAVGIEHQFPGLVQADSARFDGIVREYLARERAVLEREVAGGVLK